MGNTVKGSLILDKNRPNGTLLLSGCELVLEYQHANAEPTRSVEYSRKDGGKYDEGKIHDLLIRFDVETLLRLCYKPEFKKLRGQLSESADKQDTIVRKIIEFADTNLLIDLLLRWAKETDSRLYELLGPYQRDVPTLRKEPDDEYAP